MLTVRLICCGKLKEPFYQDACQEYLKRLTPLARVEVMELPELTGPKALEREGERVLNSLLPGGYTVAMCVEGKQLTSEQLAERLQGLQNSGVSRITLLIGSSEGLSDAVKAQAVKLSMSLMTFPHHLARVMVLEQLYRALMINCGGKYHK